MYSSIKFGWFALALTLAVGAFGVSTPATLAAAPGNDTFTGATSASIGFSDGLDTTEATTDGDDVQLNATCGAPATDASVWYAVSVGTDAGIAVDVSQSDYSAGVIVGVGNQGNLQTVACGPGAVVFSAIAGTTYYVLAFDDQIDGGGNGGSLSISFNEASTPTVDITVNPFGTVNARTGVATISGTYTCTDADSFYVFGEVRENVGRFTILGSFEFFDFGTCDGAPHSWSASVIPQNGKFAGGKAVTVAFALACGPFECADGYAEQKVQLRSGK